MTAPASPCAKPSVAEALALGRPVVALETAFLTHGLPRPANLETFRAMEDAVRAAGAVPAAVAVLGGVLRVGLGEAEAETLAGEESACKAGVADLPALAARGADAGTTVAATLWACRWAGIRVFATGGIGGVHRGGGTSFDISGDLGALARFGGCVVCSGAKVILDLPKTLQLLEALGVCVVGYRTDELPAFVSTSSGLGLRHRADTPEEAARVVRCRDALGLPQAVLLANPPPAGVAVPREAVERSLASSLAAAGGSGLSGPGVTPALLSALAHASGGATVEANRALLVANAGLGARVARSLCREP
ncbi:MAG: pseudouridine-5'-phosphate glycosidase [Deferrisomatales bacterium]|nr:pseudouridine-5'-phosphate glycosidase [Deferrisomatales bacterium]